MGQRLLRHRRLNLVVQIPELSLVVVGSQVGRCALLTLTRSTPEAKMNLITQYTFRVDTILPTPAQERFWRPVCPLLGLAVSPVHVVSPIHTAHPRVVRKRFRLFLHYQDHMILSYELSRAQRGELVVL